MTEIYYKAQPAHALKAVLLRLRSVSNEEHFALQAGTVLRPYLPWQRSRVTDICHTALSAHALHAVDVTLKSVSYEEHFTLDA
jgi:hypothetical protein